MDAESNTHTNKKKIRVTESLLPLYQNRPKNATMLDRSTLFPNRTKVPHLGFSSLA